MIYTTQIPHVKAPWKSAVTLGKFDGLHRGHQKLIECIRKNKKEQWQTVVFTFDVPPRSHMLHTPPKFLLTYEERRTLAEEFGVDILAECPFTDELMYGTRTVCKGISGRTAADWVCGSWSGF